MINIHQDTGKSAILFSHKIVKKKQKIIIYVGQNTLLRICSSKCCSETLKQTLLCHGTCHPWTFTEWSYKRFFLSFQYLSKTPVNNLQSFTVLYWYYFETAVYWEAIFSFGASQNGMKKMLSDKCYSSTCKAKQSYNLGFENLKKYEFQ